MVEGPSEGLDCWSGICLEHEIISSWRCPVSGSRKCIVETFPIFIYLDLIDSHRLKLQNCLLYITVIWSVSALRNFHFENRQPNSLCHSHI